MVSEIMLQQTQTSRVVHKFEEFITRFPTIQSLASASLRDVLIAWQGLGYNRRGMNLHKSAQIIVQHHNDIVPGDTVTLETLPGIGPNTAGSIAAFAYNKPSVFIETNIRTVFIHFFFNDQTNIHDKQLLPLIAQTVPHNNARLWYYALMDYGVMLKKNHKNPSRKSAHYTRQTPFEGSDRQIRSAIIKLLTTHPALPYDDIIGLLDRDPQRVARIIDQLVHDRLIQCTHNLCTIALD